MTIGNFQFTTVPSILMEYGAARRLGNVITERFKHKRVCLITDKFLSTSGAVAPAIASLEANGFVVMLIDDVVADPPAHVVTGIAASARDGGSDLIIGFGGGSSMDVAKLVAVLGASTQPLQDMYGVGKVTGPRLPLVLIPTTSGTGSEVTSISIVTTGETTKSGIVSPMLMADLAILDAELTLALPRHITAATGIDAMVHAIEAFTSVRLKNPVSDLLARKALSLLSSSLLRACEDGTDREAREAMMLGSTLAGQAFSNAPVAAVHALAYPLGGHFHVPHGLSNALVLTRVLRFNASSAESLYAELASHVLGESIGGQTTRQQCDAFIEYLEALVLAIGVPRRLKDVGVAADDLTRLAADAMLQQRLLVNNPRKMTEADVLDIYRSAL